MTLLLFGEVRYVVNHLYLCLIAKHFIFSFFSDRRSCNLLEFTEKFKFDHFIIKIMFALKKVIFICLYCQL